MKSKFLSLHLKDVAKSVIIFFIASTLMSLYELIQTDGALNWASMKAVLITAFGATISYLIKNFLTNNEGQFATKDVGIVDSSINKQLNLIKMSNERSVGLYGTDKIAAGLQTVVEVIADIKAAKGEQTAGGTKVTPIEGITIAVGNVGKLFNFVNSLDELGKQVVDLEVKEAPEVCTAIEAVYSPANPYIKEGAEKLIASGIGIKEAVELFLKAKEWEAKNI